ncbi:cyclase family protein [Actinomadura sp. CNU-125]|uniref:cyclase family protein n=1 Tax=Actinomadura sp. CNU-125 TaxID=1904961 RepID=UPI000A947F8A|nr:cyclase family protein [Actinomadura sp. CNU-125]
MSTPDPLLAAVAGGVRLIELGQPFFTGMPCSPNHPGFRMTLIRRHGDMMRPDGGSAANEIIVTGGHVGTHIDALSHVSHDGELHGGVDAATRSAAAPSPATAPRTCPACCAAACCWTSPPSTASTSCRPATA